jgi:dihydrofolate synthase/folylpolyglutamate synthase
VAAAFLEARVPGVLEPLGGAPLVVVDGAHTPRSAEATRAAVAACWPGRRRVLVCAVLGDKDAAAVLGALAAGADEIVLTRAPSPRSLAPDRLASALPVGHAPVRVIEDPEDALAAACDLAGAAGLVLVSGSVYLAGAVKAAYESGSARLSRMRR